MVEIAPRGELPLEFYDPGQLDAWLTDQPREVGLLMGARAALRALPVMAWDIINSRGEEDFSEAVLKVFRALATAWCMGAYSHHKGLRFAAASAGAASAGEAARDVSATAAADSAAYAVAARPVDAVRAANFAIHDNTPTFWAQVSNDARRMAPADAISVVAGAPLWDEGTPSHLLESWAQLSDYLMRAEGTWSVWIRWYENRLRGHVLDEDEEMIFAMVPAEKWDEGTTAVNNWILEHLSKPPLGPPGAKAQATILESWQPQGPPFFYQPSPQEFSAAELTTPKPVAGPSEFYELPPTAGTAPFSVTLRLPPEDSIPDQVSAAIQFSSGDAPIDVLADPPESDLQREAEQRETYDEMRAHALELAGVGSNLLGGLATRVARVVEALPEEFGEVSIRRLWLRANGLREILAAHEMAVERRQGVKNPEPDAAELPLAVAALLRTLVASFNIFIAGDANGLVLERQSLGPGERERNQAALKDIDPVVADLHSAPEVATAAARQTLDEQLDAGRTAPEGALGDKDVALARDTSGNFVLALLRKAWNAVRVEKAFAWKSLRGGAYGGIGAFVVGKMISEWPQIIQFVHRHAAALTTFIHDALNAPGLVEIIEVIKGLF